MFVRSIEDRLRKAKDLGVCLRSDDILREVFNSKCDWSIRAADPSGTATAIGSRELLKIPEVTYTDDSKAILLAISKAAMAQVSGIT